MTRDQMTQAAHHFVGASNKDDGEMVAILTAAGLEIDVAERVVAFLPIAFGRVLIAHVGKVNFTADYLVRETGKTHSLASEPIFVEALKLAAESYHSGLVPRETFTALATRSPELDAVNKALNAGADINGASLRTVELFGYKTIGKESWFKRVFG